MNRSIHPGRAVRTVAAVLPFVALLAIAAPAADVPDTTLGSPRVLILGGGPSREYNQVAIESNVRYVKRLLPPGSTCTTLFADGNAANPTVLYDESTSVNDAERVLELVIAGHDVANAAPGRYRKPNFGKVDGASKKADVTRAFEKIRAEFQEKPRPLLVYVTGHGSPDRATNENNIYNLWGDNERLTVQELAGYLKGVPGGQPIAVVMVQCFSGAFANLLYANGDPNGLPLDRDIAGFFATVKERVAAGCTSAVNEADYHDFTSYFFAALSGRDRTGHAVTGADYDHDGRVSMHEAFHYTLLHDDSIDIPVCTTDSYLRRFVPLTDAEVFKTPYSVLREWGSPAQRATLDGLSDELKLTGDQRTAAAYAAMTAGAGPPAQARMGVLEARSKLAAARRDATTRMQRKFPFIELSAAKLADAAWRKASARAIADDVRGGGFSDLVRADAAVDAADERNEKAEIAEAHRVRFVRTAKTVVLSHWMLTQGRPEIAARYARLVKSENRSIGVVAASDAESAGARPAPRVAAAASPIGPCGPTRAASL